MSANGRSRRAGDRVLVRALDVVERGREHDRPARAPLSSSGWLANWGSRSSARLTLTVPLRVRQRSIDRSRSRRAGRTIELRGTSLRVRRAKTTAARGARRRSRARRRSPAVRTRIRSTSAPDADLGAEISAAALSQRSPARASSGKAPRARPTAPSPHVAHLVVDQHVRPCPASADAQVPITPLTDRTPCTSADSNQSSRRSATLIVKSLSLEIDPRSAHRAGEARPGAGARPACRGEPASSDPGTRRLAKHRTEDSARRTAARPLVVAACEARDLLAIVSLWRIRISGNSGSARPGSGGKTP